MSSFMNSDSFEAGIGSVPNFAKIDTAPMWVSATSTSSFSPAPKAAPAPTIGAEGNNAALVGSYERWTFLKKGVDGRTLHDKISEKLKADMGSAACYVLEQQERAFDKAFKNWVITADFGVAEPSFNDYPNLQQHLKNLQTVESGITHVVFAGLSAEEKIMFHLETEPLKPGQKSKQMTDEVLKRINEETDRFLKYNQVSQREHNRT